MSWSSPRSCDKVRAASTLAESSEGQHGMSSCICRQWCCKVFRHSWKSPSLPLAKARAEGFASAAIAVPQALGNGMEIDRGRPQAPHRRPERERPRMASEAVLRSRLRSAA